MKKIAICVFTLVILFTGCINRQASVYRSDYTEENSNTTHMEETTTDENDAVEDATKTQMLKDAMLNEVRVSQGVYAKYVEQLYENIVGFYVIDMDRDSENEVVILERRANGAETYSMLDCKEKRVVCDYIGSSNVNSILNQKGYWQVIELNDEVLSYAFFEDDNNDEYIVFDLGNCVMNGTAITLEEAEKHINQYYANPAVCYEYTKENIQKHIDIRPSDVEDISIELPNVEEFEVKIDNLNALQRVVIGMDEFVDTGDGTIKKINDLQEAIYYDGAFNVDQASFWYVDFNDDNQKEVVVNFLGSMYIFYELDEQIYMFAWSYRGMSPLYEDGTFDDNNCCRYKITELTPKGVTIESTLENNVVSPATRYTFTRNNILNILAN